MPDVQSSTLRIYCLCGQKMRVSEKMYGLPGKCVACRQKIRIPKKEDVPEGVTEIHLKDHPELVRGPVKASAAVERAALKAMAKAGSAPDSGDESTPNTELDLMDSPPPVDTPPPSKPKKPSRGSMPVDVLPILQILCSLEYKFSRELDALQINSHDDEVMLAELEGHQARVRKLRSHLDDQLHQRLMETAIELANTQEKLAQARLGARVGDASWSEYQANVHRLRTRRERLERRQQNLRGWLATRDPYVAGGLLDLSIEDIPEEGFTVSLPSESGDESPLLAELAEGLRSALENRARVRQRAAEILKMSKSDSGAEMDELRKEAEQRRLVARAAVAFAHDRLQQLKKDYASDGETANAMLAGARDKLRMDVIARAEYDSIEREILRSKKDLARAQAVIDRALAANASTDVPAAHGTFLQRLGLGQRTTPDTLIAYGSAVLLVLSVFAPSIGTLSLVMAAAEFGGGLFLLPLGLAAAVGGATLLGDAGMRGRAYLFLWLAGLVAAAYLVHESAFSDGPMATRFRSGSAWYLRPGAVLLLVGMIGVLAAAIGALRSEPQYRLWPLIAAAIGAAATALIVTDLAGARRPAPRLEVALEADAGAGVVRVHNEGGRVIRLLNRQTDARGSYNFYIDQPVGASSSKPVEGQGPLWDGSIPERDGELYTLRPGALEEVPFVLPPGDYRAVLETGADAAPIMEPFTVRPPSPQAAGPSVTPAPTTPQDAISPATEGVLPPGETPAGEPEITPTDEAGAAEGTTEVEAEIPAQTEMPAEQSFEDLAPLVQGDAPAVELTGVVTGDDQQLRFSLRLHYPDGAEERIIVGMGGKVWGEWTLTEFNPDESTVTLQHPDGLLILRRRVPVSLGPNRD